MRRRHGLLRAHRAFGGVGAFGGLGDNTFPGLAGVQHLGASPSRRPLGSGAKRDDEVRIEIEDCLRNPTAPLKTGVIYGFSRQRLTAPSSEEFASTAKNVDRTGAHPPANGLIA